MYSDIQDSICNVSSGLSENGPKFSYIISQHFLYLDYSWHPKAIVNGASIKLKNCKRSRRQRFKTSEPGPIVARNPNLCLAYANASPTTGAKVKLQTCSGGSNQDWK